MNDTLIAVLFAISPLLMALLFFGAMMLQYYMYVLIDKIFGTNLLEQEIEIIKQTIGNSI